MSSRIASFDATYTASVDDGGTKSTEDSYRVLVDEVQSPASENIAVYTWDFDVINDTYPTVVSEIGSATITKIEISFRYNLNQDALELSVFRYGTGDPATQTGAQILAAISATELATVDVLSTNQTGLTIELDDSDSFYYETQLDIAASLNVTTSLHRHVDLDASDGSVELSGNNLFGENTAWRDAVAGEATAPPLLIITYDVTTEAHPVLNMKYTTSIPGTDQSTPLDSIGKYIAPNDVYPSADLASSINSTQTTIPISTSSTLPTVVGLASAGPEIFKYNVIDTTNNQLTGATRGIAPLSSFPAGFDSFKVPEKVYYLNDLNLLFDTRPSSGLVQYRCVAITNTDTGDDFFIQDGQIGIAQDATANVQIRIGVELPKFDARTGISIDDATVTSSTTLVAAIEEDDGFFDGAAIKFLAPVEYGVVDTYVFDTLNSIGIFTFVDSVTGLNSGRNFVILPAPAQQLANDATVPTSNSGRFGGFSENASGIDVSLLEHGVTMQEHDLFYVWLRRTLTVNVEETNDTGAALIFRYRDIDI